MKFFLFQLVIYLIVDLYFIFSHQEIWVIAFMSFIVGIYFATCMLLFLDRKVFKGESYFANL